MSSALRKTVTAGAIAAAVVASIAGVSHALWFPAPSHQSFVTAVVNGAVVLAFAVVGAVVAAARPTNRIGWAMLIGGVTWSLGGAAADLAYRGIVAAPGTVPFLVAVAIAGAAMRSVGWYVVTLVVPALFPDGRLPATRRRWFSWALVIIIIGSVVDPITDPQATYTNLGAWHNPLGHGVVAHALSAAAFFAHVPLAAVATVAVVCYLIGRWRRGDALRRQQIILLAAGAGLAIVAVPIAFAFESAGGWVFGVAALPLPIAIGFAVLARDLYDLRTAANRTLVWITLSAVVAAVYALVIAGAASLLHVSRRVAWLPWVAAAVVAVSFAPLRDALQRGLNRLTFGRWDEPYEVLAALGQRLEATTDVDRLIEDVTVELRGLGLRDVQVTDEDGRIVARDGDGSVDGDSSDGDSPDGVIMDLSAYGQPVGTLRYRPPSAAALRSRDRRLLDDLAGHLAAVLHARRLTVDLQRALERLVVAREEERRRLRRDLHDGLGPALAGHLLRLDLVASKIGPGGPGAEDVAILQREMRATVLEVRRVVEGLRPPALDNLGLAGAVTEATKRLVAGAGIKLEVDVGELPGLPAAVEVAVYRIVTEAVTNVVRHAQASTCHVELQTRDATLWVRVSDDGGGVSTSNGGPPGHGLQTMRERAEELRGRLHVVPGPGMTVLAELPLSLGPANVGQYVTAQGLKA